MDLDRDESPGPFDPSTSGPIKSLRITSNKPILPFLTMPYVHAQRILHLARNVDAFHVQSVYIARQALRLVMHLNDWMKEDDGPDRKEREERIVLLKELVALEDAMKQWGTEAGLQEHYVERVSEIKQHYNKFVRPRFYVWPRMSTTVKEEIYQKLLAYDQSSMALIQRQRVQDNPNDDGMDIDDPMSD